MSITDKDVQLVVVLLIPTIKKRIKFKVIFKIIFFLFFERNTYHSFTNVSEYYLALV